MPIPIGPMATWLAFGEGIVLETLWHVTFPTERVPTPHREPVSPVDAGKKAVPPILGPINDEACSTSEEKRSYRELSVSLGFKNS
jgi:hypothetical protein